MRQTDPQIGFPPSSSAAKERLEENRFNLVVFGEFKRALDVFLTNERALSLQSALNGAIKAEKDILVSIKLERKAVQTPVEELEEKLRLFDDRLVTLRKQKDEDLCPREQILNKLVIETLNADLAVVRSGQRGPLYQELFRISEDTPGNAAVLRQMNESMPIMVHEMLAAWQAVEAPKLSETINERLQSFTDNINLLTDEVHEIPENVQEAVDASLEHFDTQLLSVNKVFAWLTQIREGLHHPRLRHLSAEDRDDII